MRNGYTEEQVAEMLRKRKSTTQQALADEVGVQVSYINGVLKGRVAPGDSILKFLNLERGYITRTERAA
jgi:transcriptional regulator with XRE-family HTH domain